MNGVCDSASGVSKVVSRAPSGGRLVELARGVEDTEYVTGERH
jgi:hypothetical protein